MKRSRFFSDAALCHVFSIDSIWKRAAWRWTVPRESPFLAPYALTATTNPRSPAIVRIFFTAAPFVESVLRGYVHPVARVCLAGFDWRRMLGARADSSRA